MISLDLTLSGYKEPDALAFADRLRARVRALPGVQHAAFAADLPLDGGRMGFGSLRVPGLQPPDGADSFRADWNAVSPDYFKTLNMPPGQRPRLHRTGHRGGARRDHHQRGDGA